MKGASELRALARAMGVQLSFRDGLGTTRRASIDGLLAVTRALGADIRSVDDAPRALREFREFRERERHPSEDVRGRAPAARRGWGVFLPLYALQTDRSSAIADLTDLETLLSWTDKLGGSFVATLPLFAAFLDDPFDPSPYAPVSRMFFNELYADPERTPEFDASSEAREVVTSPSFRDDVERLRAMDVVDYRAAYALKRRVLAPLADRFFADGARRLDAFCAAEPLARDYAAFRAGGDAGAERFHLYAQLVMHEQLLACSRAHPRSGLFLDLPIAVHPQGFDAHRFSDAFVSGVSIGAPPDALFAGGQNWGATPLHPQRAADVFEKTLTKLADIATAIRIDHVMGLHRQYWIPDGMDPDQGVYVRYPAEDLYARLVAVAQRTDTVVVGEDLGTVPRGVRPAMRRHGICSTYVLQFAIGEDGIEAPTDQQAAGLNTHDTQMFATFLEGLPGDVRLSLARSLHAGDGTDEATRAALRMLAGSDAPLVVVNLEDLWSERRPQNEPGTTLDERPNWQRKAALPFERFAIEPLVTETLGEIDRLRSEELMS